MRYWPNPAHKRTTSEAGPPAWSPAKEPCPDDMTVAERNALLAASIADPGPTSRRYAVRRLPSGRLEFFEAKWTENVEGEDVFHGHPTVRVPVRFLRVFLAAGAITRPEYKQLTRDLAL